MRYKLVMFGFPDLCRDYEDVLLHLKQIPVARANYETLEQCYLIDVLSGVRYNISCNDRGFFVEGVDKDGL